MLRVHRLTTSNRLAVTALAVVALGVAGVLVVFGLALLAGLVAVGSVVAVGTSRWRRLTGRPGPQPPIARWRPDPGQEVFVPPSGRELRP